MVDKVDALSVSSRTFYERTKSKLIFSFIIGSIAMMVLGFCSIAGGLSLAAGNTKDIMEVNEADDLVVATYQATQSGYGFACFIYLCAFVLLTIAACFVSPFICGSFNERNIIRSPQELNLNEKADSNV